MTEKYIDLAKSIWYDVGYIDGGFVQRTLNWLDENPDQAPGRTITESELDGKRRLYGEGWSTGFLQAGGEIIPDPTNVDRLKALYMEWKREGPTALDFAEWMDVRGVKAPGGDDD